MAAMVAQFLILVIIPGLLIAAAGWDLTTFTIPNSIPAALVAQFLLLAALTGMPVAGLGWHALAGLSGLAGGFLLFAFGYVGGGDAKLFAAVMLLFGLRDGAAFAIVSALFGGVLTISILAMRYVPLPQFLAQPWILRLHDDKEGVPYGVALAAGAFVLLPYSEIFHAVVVG